MLRLLFSRKPREADSRIVEKIRRELESSEGYFLGDWPNLPLMNAVERDRFGRDLSTFAAGKMLGHPNPGSKEG